MKQSLVGIAVLLVWGTLVPVEVRADEVAPAEREMPPAYQHFLRGETAYQQGNYAEAVDEWTAAYELDPRAELQYNLAQAYERLAKLAEAAAALDIYLAGAHPDDPNQENARARRAALSARVSRTGIRITGGPSGATIYVDGEERGVTPRPDVLVVSPGTHEVRIEGSGYWPYRASVIVPGGEVSDIVVEMVEQQESTGPGALPWIVAGTGVAMVAGAAVLGSLAVGKAGDATSAESGEADSARSLALGADILGIVGAAAISAGLIWYFVGSRNSGDEGASTALSPIITPQAVGMDARWNF